MSFSVEGTSNESREVLRSRAHELRAVVLPGAGGFRLVAPKGVAAKQVRRPAPGRHGSTHLVARLEEAEGLSVLVQRSSLENDVDAASWLELSLGTREEDYGPVSRALVSGMPTGTACSQAERGERPSIVKAMQRGRALWMVEASLPRARWDADRMLAQLAVESFQPAGPGGFAEGLDGILVRGLGVELRWPASWFFTSEIDVPGGVVGLLERNLRGTSVGLMQVLLGAPGEEAEMRASANEWLGSVGATSDGRGVLEKDVSRRALGQAVLVVALAGPSRIEDASLWLTNRRARDIVLEQSVFVES